MSHTKAAPASNDAELTTFSINYQLIRNVTSPDEQSVGVTTYIANLPAEEIVSLGTRGNLRSYIAEYNPRQRNRVHEAIAATMEFIPERFIVRNSGFVISASSIDVDDKQKVATLKNASILNGAQSQGEIKRFLAGFSDDKENTTPFYVRAEIIVDSNAQEVVETAIARNTATPVKSVSQAGARGHLNDLAATIAKHFPGEKLMLDETEQGLDPIKLLQYCRLLMPSEISGSTSVAEMLRAYKNPAQCLSDFSQWHADAEKASRREPHDPKNARKYQFTVSIAPAALKEYRYWNGHEGWNGKTLWENTKKGGRAVRRDPKSKRIVWVAPGILFPLIGAMSEFVVEEKPGRWSIVKPTSFKADDMVSQTVRQFRGHNSDPMMMGRSESAYDALRIYPQTLMDVLEEMRK